MHLLQDKKKLKQINIIVIYLFVNLDYGKCNAINVQQSDYISNMIKCVLNEVKPYQVSVIIRNYEYECLSKNYHVDVNFIVKQISIRRPVLIIKSSIFKDFRVYTNPERPLLQNPRYTTLFLSLLHVNFEYKDSVESMKIDFKQNIKFIMNLSHNIRPICLFILNIHKQISTKSINAILKYAWIKKFLEITIIQLVTDDNICKSNILVSTYNPFTNVYSVTCFFSGITIFLNKLKQMNGYPFNVALIVQPPAVNFDKDLAGNPININGSDYGSLLITSEYLNFSMNLITPNITNYFEPFGNACVNLIDLIIEGQIDYGANQVFMYFNIQNRSEKLYNEHSDVIWLDEVIALVPIFQSSLWVQFNISLIIASIIAHVGLMYLIIKVCKFNGQYWSSYYIFQILLGNPIPKLPRRSIERLFFVLLFLMSYKYSTNWYAKLADKNLNELNMGPYESINDLINADITLETHNNYAKIIFYEENELTGRLKKKVKLVTDLLNCPSRVLENPKIGCLIDKSVAAASIVRSTHNEAPRMKILDNYVFWIGPKGYILTEASPYVIEFDKIFQRITDTGLWMKWRIDNNKKNNKKYTLLTNENSTMVFDQFLKQKLVTVLILGFIISCVTLLCELIVNHVQIYIQNTKRNRVSLE